MIDKYNRNGTHVHFIEINVFFTIHFEILETEILESLQTQKSPSVANGLCTMSCNRQYSNLPA